MALITLLNAQLAFGHLPLLDHADFALEAGERVGLIGRNGAGKSSLLKILGGLAQPDDGTLQLQGGTRTAYVAQEPNLASDATIFEAVSQGLARVRGLIDAYCAGQGELDALQAEIEALDGWNWEQRVTETLHRLHLAPQQPVATLSGGTRKRVALAQALVAQPDVLLLDEPTNHLDLDAIRWLEDLLLAFRGSVVTITHDRAFLDRVASRIVELDRGRLRSYPGNFTAYQQQKQEQLAQEAVVQAKADRLLAQEEVWIRKGVEARRTRAQARVVRLEQLRAQRQARREAVGSVRLDIARGVASGKLVAELTHVSKTFAPLEPQQPPRKVVDDFSAVILRGDKLGLIGANGSGKTTLLKLILGELAPDPPPAHAPATLAGESPWGTVRQGANLQVAYFDQMRDALDLDATLEDFISPGSEWIEIGSRRQHVKSYLGDFLFSPARASSPVRSLSGGERNRLLLARLFARPANVLVLDEPTNDLDIDTLELLEDLLQSYEGTVFLVSHDRTFLDHVVTSTLVHEGAGRWREYEGGVQDWLTQSQRATQLARQERPPADRPGSRASRASNPAQPAPEPLAAATATAPAAGLAAPAVTAAAAPAQPADAGAANASGAKPLPASASRSRKLSFKEQRELAELPQRVASLEAEQREIDAALADGSLYATDSARAVALSQRHAEIDAALLDLLERWQALGG